jgi:phage gp36-like protein
MSTFITETDYQTSIDSDILLRIAGGNSGLLTSLLDDAENTAIELMRGYLNARYDVVAIFNATGSDRNPILVKYAVDISLYYLYQRLPANQVPDMRVYNYEAAEKWLHRVQKQEVNPPDLPLVPSPDGDAKEYVQYGSNPRRNNHLN